MKSLSETLNTNEKSALFDICCRTNHKNLVCKRNNKGQYVPFKKSEIYDLMGFSKPTCKKTLDSLLEKKILKCTEDGYYVSPLYIMNNPRLSFETYLAFEKELNEILPMRIITEMHNRIEAMDECSE